MPTLLEVRCMTPRDAAQVEEWLRNYWEWAGTVECGGLSRADAGSQIRSTRRGRPTESAVMAMSTLEGRVVVVKQWLGDLSFLERAFAAYYTEGRAMRQIAREVGKNHLVVRGQVLGLPAVIYSRWYGG